MQKHPEISSKVTGITTNEELDRHIDNDYDHARRARADETRSDILQERQRNREKIQRDSSSNNSGKIGSELLQRTSDPLENGVDRSSIRIDEGGENPTNNSQKVTEQAKKPTEGFYAKLIKDESVDIETPKQAVVTNKNGEKRNIEYLDNAPDGWVKDEYATTAPKGYSWYHNGKSVLKGERKSILVKDGGFHYTPDSPDSGEDFDLGRFINNSKDRMDIANSRKQGITVGELIEKNKFLKPIEDALSDISDYTISPMPDNVKNPRRRATHLSKSKMIWLNMDVLRNDPRGFVVSFMHEVQHAKQMKKYKELSSKGKLTPEEKRFVDNYKELKKVNKIRLEYYNKHKKFLDDALKRLDELNQTEAQEYINSLTPMQREILKTYKKLYDDYHNTPFEVEARQAGEFYARRVEREGYTLGNQGRIEEEGYTHSNQGRLADRSVGNRPRMQTPENNERTSSGRPRENEKRSGKTPQDGSGIEFDIDNVDKIVKKVKKKDNTFVHVTSKILTPISTRLEDINPVLKHALRKFELDSALAENRSAETIKPFVDKLDKIEKVKTGKNLNN